MNAIEPFEVLKLIHERYANAPSCQERATDELEDEWHCHFGRLRTDLQAISAVGIDTSVLLGRYARQFDTSGCSYLWRSDVARDLANLAMDYAALQAAAAEVQNLEQLFRLEQPSTPYLSSGDSN